jgi:3-methylcrotonyl-CoA carboxylase alpha subunit
MAAGRFFVRDGENSRTVDVHADGGIVVEGADRPVAVAALEPGEYEVTDGERRRHVFVAGPAEAPEIFVDGRVYRLEVISASERRQNRAAAHVDSLTAPMPATVVKVLVEPGQQVCRGDMLLTLEAMKMELPVRAPHDGIVKAIRCHEGELVQAGVRLLDLG